MALLGLVPRHRASHDCAGRDDDMIRVVLLVVALLGAGQVLAFNFYIKGEPFRCLTIYHEQKKCTQVSVYF